MLRGKLGSNDEWEKHSSIWRGRGMINADEYFVRARNLDLCCVVSHH